MCGGALEGSYGVLMRRWVGVKIVGKLRYAPSSDVIPAKVATATHLWGAGIQELINSYYVVTLVIKRKGALYFV